MMQFLMDENVPPAYREQLLRRLPDLTVWAVGQPGVPAKGRWIRTYWHGVKIAPACW
jgi:hypothetical protein